MSTVQLLIHTILNDILKFIVFWLYEGFTDITLKNNLIFNNYLFIILKMFSVQKTLHPCFIIRDFKGKKK